MGASGFIEPRFPSCELGLNIIVPPMPGIEAPEFSQEEIKKAELYLSAKKIGLSVERLLEMRNYTAKLKKQFPKMKEARIQRKVAEYFKIKLT